jgi:hypothetical protein
VPGQRKTIGVAAARAYRDRLARSGDGGKATAPSQPRRPAPAPAEAGGTVGIAAGVVLLLRMVSRFRRPGRGPKLGTE